MWTDKMNSQDKAYIRAFFASSKKDKPKERRKDEDRFTLSYGGQNILTGTYPLCVWKQRELEKSGNYRHPNHFKITRS